MSQLHTSSTQIRLILKKTSAKRQWFSRSEPLHHARAQTELAGKARSFYVFRYLHSLRLVSLESFLATFWQIFVRFLDSTSCLNPVFFFESLRFVRPIGIFIRLPKVPLILCEDCPADSVHNPVCCTGCAAQPNACCVLFAF